MPRVVHFEIHAEQPQRAIGFYESTFGWKFNKWAGHDYWLIRPARTSSPASTAA